MDAKNFNVWLFLFIFSGLLNVSLIGGMCNLMVVANNEGKMPVYEPFSNSSVTSSERHFYFNDSTSINYYYLSDIFKIGTLHFSIGDSILLTASIMTFFMNIILIIYYIKFRKQYGNYKRKSI
jgi:hypothetical protein